MTKKAVRQPQYWIMKTEPSEYSISDLERDKRTFWDGVRNYQVRNMFRDQMQVGDIALYYHSNAGSETGIVGEMEVISEAAPDPTQFAVGHPHFDEKSSQSDPRWLGVEVRFRKKYRSVVTLSMLRAARALKNLLILRKGNRLSVTPITEAEYRSITDLASNTL